MFLTGAVGDFSLTASVLMFLEGKEGFGYERRICKGGGSNAAYQGM